MTETAIMRDIMLALSKLGARVFRNNVGVAKYQADNGQWHRVKYGLCTGSSDVIGLVPVTVTSDMVGQTIGVFTAIEVKAGKGVASDEQEAFINMVRERGGIAGVARSVEEAIALLHRRAA